MQGFLSLIFMLGSEGSYECGAPIIVSSHYWRKQIKYVHAHLDIAAGIGLNQAFSIVPETVCTAYCVRYWWYRVEVCIEFQNAIRNHCLGSHCTNI